MGSALVMRRLMGTQISDEFPDLDGRIVWYEWFGAVEARQMMDCHHLIEVLKVKPLRPLKALVLPPKGGHKEEGPVQIRIASRGLVGREPRSTRGDCAGGNNPRANSGETNGSGGQPVKAEAESSAGATPHVTSRKVS